MSIEACLKAKVLITNFGGICCTAYTACGRKILARITCAFLSYNALFSVDSVDLDLRLRWFDL